VGGDTRAKVDSEIDEYSLSSTYITQGYLDMSDRAARGPEVEHTDSSQDNRSRQYYYNEEGKKRRLEIENKVKRPMSILLNQIALLNLPKRRSSEKWTHKSHHPRQDMDDELSEQKVTKTSFEENKDRAKATTKLLKDSLKEEMERYDGSGIWNLDPQLSMVKPMFPKVKPKIEYSNAPKQKFLINYPLKVKG
jgi:hypothetical protein